MLLTQNPFPLSHLCDYDTATPMSIVKINRRIQKVEDIQNRVHLSKYPMHLGIFVICSDYSKKSRRSIQEGAIEYGRTDQPTAGMRVDKFVTVEKK